MKKLLSFAIGLVCTASLFAGGIENKTNMSTGYLRNPSRNTENQRPDAAFYNIAGTAFMKNGLYLGVGNQFVAKEYKNTLRTDDFSSYGFGSGTSYNDETFVFFYPDAEIVYKHNQYAIFANFGIYAGGGKLEYSEGTSATALAFGKAALSNKSKAESYAQQAAAASAAGNTSAAAAASAAASQSASAAASALGAAKDHSLTVNSITYGEQIGASVRFNDYVSFAGAIRLLQGTQKMSISSDYLAALGNGSDEISYNAFAFGVSPVFGIHAKPIDRLDASFQYQMATQMHYKLSDVEGNIASSFGIENDKEFRSDLAHVLNFGLGYQLLDPLYLSTSFNLYINSDSEMNTVLSENDYDNSFEIALGADYRFNKTFLASLGAAYGHQGTNDDSNNTFNPVLDSLQVGGGLEISIFEEMVLNLGATYVNYFNRDYYLNKTYRTELSKKLFMFSLGFTYHFAGI